MAIFASLNTGYDPDGKIFQKYTPLGKWTLSIEGDDGRGSIEKIAKDRMVAIAQASINLYKLTFYGDKITTIAQTEKGRQPPLAIISSGRSDWIKAMYKNGSNILTSLGKDRFDNIGDVDPFMTGEKIPIYFPYRLSQQDSSNRGIYIFVQESEYQIYVEDLTGTGITVIGYSVGNDTDLMLGFGTCRYAAAKFFNYIDVPKVWFLDDNILYISNVDEFYNFEGKMKDRKVINNSEPLWALGSHGAREYVTPVDISNIYKWYKNKRITIKGNPAPYKFLQQAVLWNVDQLKKENNIQQTDFNYSPYFINSGEDLSISYFLGMNRCQAIKACDIYKGSDPSDQLTENQRQVKEELNRRKDEIRLKLKEGTQTTIKDTYNGDQDTDLWKLFNTYQNRRNKKYTEPANTTYIKAGEQLLLKWMVIENLENKNLNPDNKDSAINNIPAKLLNPLFNFSTLKYKDLMNIENDEIEYSILLMDTSIPAQ